MPSPNSGDGGPDETPGRAQEARNLAAEAQEARDRGDDDEARFLMKQARKLDPQAAADGPGDDDEEDEETAEDEDEEDEDADDDDDEDKEDEDAEEDEE